MWVTRELLGVRPTKPADGRIERIVVSGSKKKKKFWDMGDGLECLEGGVNMNGIWKWDDRSDRRKKYVEERINV